MHDREKAIRVAREWVQKAENDLKTATHVLTLGEDAPTDTICFHCQQAVEKYLKALLIFRGIKFPRIHDIERLVRLLPVADRPHMSVEEQGALTDYATMTRYPGSYEPISLEEATLAVKLAWRVREQIRRLLPPEVLEPLTVKREKGSQ
ncbi:MAG: HEPN domain-containing protein [Thermoguttaceae bacterium]|nr:HEPN domain-containing protein [Thermoguttaceae bacterium]MDW8078689.1 HEPN domain-containing protein [Thermoguttaceae bacterium]